MPWSSDSLPVMEPSPERWPLRIAAEMLAPPGMSERQVRDKLRRAGIRPVAKMASGVPGTRHVPLCDVSALIAFFDLVPGN